MSGYTEDKIIDELVSKYELDIRTIRFIVHYPLKFLKRKMQDMNDWRPIRLRYFGIFGLTKQAKDKYLNKI